MHLFLRHVLHKYANEDVSLGSWFIGLDVEHIDDRRLCCGTPPGKVLVCFQNHQFSRQFSKQYITEYYITPSTTRGNMHISLSIRLVGADCEWKAQAGNICVASFDWTCSGICRSADRIKEVHRRCGEGENALWSASF